MRVAYLVLLTVMLSMASSRALAEDDGARAIEAKAAELAPADASAAERIIVLHRYVRDEIRQVTTQYG